MTYNEVSYFLMHVFNNIFFFLRDFFLLLCTVCCIATYSVISRKPATFVVLGVSFRKQEEYVPKEVYLAFLDARVKIFETRSVSSRPPNLLSPLVSTI